MYIIPATREQFVASAQAACIDNERLQVLLERIWDACQSEVIESITQLLDPNPVNPFSRSSMRKVRDAAQELGAYQRQRTTLRLSQPASAEVAGAIYPPRT